MRFLTNTKLIANGALVSHGHDQSVLVLVRLTRWLSQCIMRGTDTNLITEDCEGTVFVFLPEACCAATSTNRADNTRSISKGQLELVHALECKATGFPSQRPLTQLPFPHRQVLYQGYGQIWTACSIFLPRWGWQKRLHRAGSAASL